MRSITAEFVRAARAVAVAAEPDCWMRTPRGSHRRVAACFAAGRRRCGPHPGSGRCTGARHPACKPSAVPMCRDILQRKPRYARQCRRSKARDQARSVQFVYSHPPRLAKNSINEAWEGSWPTTKCESHRRSRTATYLTLPILFTDRVITRARPHIALPRRQDDRVRTR